MIGYPLSAEDKGILIDEVKNISVLQRGLTLDPLEELKDRLQDKIKRNTRLYRLSNGLRVILVKNGFSPTLACYLKVGVGSSNEPFDLSGAAHFLEHLLFKGNQTLGTKNFVAESHILEQLRVDLNRLDRLERQLLDPLLNLEKAKIFKADQSKITKRVDLLSKLAKKHILSEEYSKAFSLAGAVGFNAYTSSDVTNYQVKVPKEQLSLWAFLESQRFLSPQFREFYQERKVILEERNTRYNSNPASLVYELFLNVAFGFSPYGKPVIGLESNILRLSWDDVLVFYHENYIPSKMVITIVGDVDFEKDIRIIKKFFLEIPSRKEPEFPPIEHHPLLGRKTATLEADIQPLLLTGWYVPSLKDPDYPVFLVLENILTGGDSARLTDRLVYEKKIASSVSSSFGFPGEKLGNTFVIQVKSFQDTIYDRIYDEIKVELEDLIQNGISDEELIRVKNKWLMYFLDLLDSNAGIADRFSYYELLLADHTFVVSLIERISQVSSKDIQRVVATYFRDSKNTTITVDSTLK